MPKIQNLRILAVLLLVGVFSMGLGVTAVSADSYSSADTAKIAALCSKKLNISTKSKNKEDKTVLGACEEGYIVGLEHPNDSSSCTGAYKGDAKALNACKGTGFNLGKANSLNIKGNPSQGNPGGGQGANPSGSLSQSGISAGYLPNSTANSDTVSRILNVVFVIIGSFALLNITLSGLKYITSAGNEQRTSEAKNGIVYSLVGLAVAISAEAIVAFVVHRT